MAGTPQIPSSHESSAQDVRAREKLQLEALLDLTRLHTTKQQDWTSNLRLITERAARVLSVGRVSIWRYSEHGTGIECLSLYDHATELHSAGMVLREPEFPGYFAALRAGDLIAADDAHTHDATKELSTVYLMPLSISSMLDVPFHLDGAMAGVVCCEQVGPPRIWCEDEKRFTLALTSLVSLAIETEERKRVELCLQESKNHYQAFVDNLPVVVCCWKPGYVLTYANAEYRDLFAAGQDVAGRTWTDFLPPDEIAGVLRNYSTEPAVVKFEADVLSHDGRRLSFAWVDVPIFDTKGNLVEYQSVGMDITSIKKREQQMRLQSAALETAKAAIVITDREGKIVWTNPAFTTTTGYELAEALGKTNTELLGSGTQSPAFYEEMWTALSEHGTWEGEFINLRKNGTLYTDETTITSVRDEAGEITHYVAIKEDVTERRQLERQVAQAQRLESIARMAGQVGHDFNNMLAVILSHTENLLRDPPSDEHLTEALREIDTAARRSEGLTIQLLGFARQQVIVAEVLDLNEVVSGLLNRLEATLGEGIKLVWNPSPTPLHVKLDPSQLGQILSHLMANAREAGAGTVTLETATTSDVVGGGAQSGGELSAEHVRLSVTDDGVGMDQAIRSHAFEPFFTTKAMGEGSGLGLATVSGIVKQNGGVVALHSSPGRGTTVEIFLAKHALDQATVQAGSPTRTRLPKGEGTVLIVDDEQVLLKLNKRLVERLGYTVLAASDPAVALELSRSYAGEIHLLMTDVLMPGMTGMDVWRTLHLERPAMKCLFVSGYAAPDSILGRSLDDSSDYLGKPFPLQALKQKIEKLLHGGPEPAAGDGQQP